MRIIVFFDLPVVTKKDRKIYSQFRRFLLKDGYDMLQFYNEALTPAEIAALYASENPEKK